MKKLVALVLSVVLMISVLPLNAFAMDWDSVVSISFADTYVYDGMQEDGGKFEQFHVKIITTFEDGNTSEEDRIAYRNGGVEVNWGTLYLSDNQDTELWEVGNIYQVTGTVGSFTNTFNVEVRENPMQEISIDDFNVVKSNMCFSEEYGDVYRIRNLLNGCHSCVASYKDGSRTEFSYENLSFGEYYISVDLIVTCDIPYEDWEVGNTYEVTASLLGVADTFSVTVLEIESFEVEDVECIENFDGHMDGYWDENDNYVDNAWFNYNIYPKNITITFTNSLSISGNPSEISGYTGFYPNCHSEQSYENQWGLGNHTATINICGHEQNYNVKVVETPIKDIIIDDITYIEGTNRWNDGPNYYEYYINPETLTVVLKDDTVITGTYNDVCEQLGYYGDCSSDQSYENLWDVGEHKATINMMGFVKEYSINIIKSPISSIEIEDIEILECTHGGYNDKENYMYTSFSPTFSVTFSDGSVKSGLTEGITIDEEYYSLEIRDYTDQYVSPWVVGNTYEITGSIFGVSDTFNVTIKETPVESVEIKDISVIENTHGYEDGSGNYIYSYLNPSYTVTLKDGRKFSSSGGGIDIDGEWYSLSIDTDNQRGEYWTAGNTYEAVGSILGVSDTFNLTIKETPVESVEIKDISVIEYTHGYEDGSGNYIYSYLNPSYTVTLKDGRKFSSSGGGIDVDGEWYYLSISTDNQRVEGWTAGNTYQTTGSILGVSDTFNVTIKETPIESLVIDDIDVIVNTNGYYDSEYNCYIYSPNPTSFTAILKDGSHIQSVNGVVEIAGEHFGISSYDTNYWSQVENPWTVGNTYQMSASVGGFSDTFNVTITESPVVSIEVEDVTCIEGTRGQYVVDDGGYYFYNDIYFRLNYKVTLSDGSVLEAEEPYIEGGGGGDHGVYINGEFYTISNVSDNQDVSHWSVGTHTATAEFMGATDEFNVTITESPVESIDIEDITLIKGIDSYDNGSYESYNINPTYTLTFKDGSQKTINNGKAVSFDGYYSRLDIDINQHKNPLEVGNTYELTGSFGSLTDQFKVTVIDNPVTDIEIITPPQKTEYTVGERFDLKGATLRVHFNDNAYEDINIKYNCDRFLNYGYKYYSNHLQNSYGIDYINDFTEAGKQKVAITFLGKTVQYEVNVKENLWEKIEIKNGADKSLIITAVNPDGTTLEMKVLDADFQSGGEGCLNGLIMTDKGIFGGTFYLSDGNAWIKLEGLTSNTLTDCEWMNLYFNMHYYNNPFSNIYYFQQSIRFNGKITAENIDSLILLASEYIDLPANRVSGQAIREALLKTFAVKEIDLSLSKNYDHQSDTYIWNGGIRYPDNYILPTEIKYNNGAWNIKITQSDETVVYLKLDDELKIISINYEYIPGDIDDDSELSDWDGVLLARYLAGWNVEIPTLDALDIDGDGEITDWDGVVLDRYLAGWDISIG